jgi:tripartite-type tricarboxylate transporter receptor subunit TctC
MPRSDRPKGLSIIFYGLIALFSSIATAQNFPNRPLVMIIPYAAGGSADVLGRVIADEMGKVLGQTVIPELKPGAGGNIGAEYIAKLVKPDGYTFLFASVSLSTGPSLAKLNFDPTKDLKAIAGVASIPSLMLISNDSPYKNLPEFVNAVKANKVKASYGSSGNNTGSHLVGELFSSASGIEMTHVPYKGSGAVYPDLIAGRITVLTDVMGSSLPQAKGGMVRALAITSNKRSKLLPNVPTIAEQGYPGFEFGTWFGFFAPAGVPSDVMKTLEQAILQALKSEPVRERLDAVGATLLPGPGVEFEKWYLADVQRWAKLVKEGRLQRSD